MFEPLKTETCKKCGSLIAEPKELIGIVRGRKTNKKILIGTVIGLVVGLVLGIFVSVIFNLPTSFHTEAGTNNPVQVSGTVSETKIGTIQFINWNETISTRYSHYNSIINGKYSILLAGGQPYDVYIGTGETGYSYKFSLDIPLNITTLTANF